MQYFLTLHFESVAFSKDTIHIAPAHKLLRPGHAVDEFEFNAVDVIKHSEERQDGNYYTFAAKMTHPCSLVEYMRQGGKSTLYLKVKLRGLGRVREA